MRQLVGYRPKRNSSRKLKHPMEHPLVEKPGNATVLGGGRRASTLRSRIRAVRKELSWLAGTFEVAVPQELAHVTEFRQVTRSEPCNHGALKRTHQALVKSQVLKKARSSPPTLWTRWCAKNFFPLRSQVVQLARHRECLQFSSEAWRSVWWFQLHFHIGASTHHGCCCSAGASKIL